MKRNKSKKITLIGLLLVSIILMSIVFALVSQTLTINGTEKIAPLSWDIHFEQIDDTNLSSILTPIIGGEAKVKKQAKIKTGATEIGDYEIILTRPGDSVTYEFNVANRGEINAEIEVISNLKENIEIISTITDSEQRAKDKEIVEEAIIYTLKYDNNEEVKKGDLLGVGQVRKMILKLEFTGDMVLR